MITKEWEKEMEHTIKVVEEMESLESLSMEEIEREFEIWKEEGWNHISDEGWNG